MSICICPVWAADTSKENLTVGTSYEEPSKIYFVEDILNLDLSDEELNDIYKIYKDRIEGVPLMYQTDYPHIPFSHGTVATSGCGISCAAMVISYLTDTDVTPGLLGETFNLPGKSNMERMEAALDHYDISYTVSFSWNEAYEALSNNQVVISLQNPGIFTDYGHFILLTGINEEGLITVNDPYQPNYYSPAKRANGLANGFSSEQVKENASGYWIFEKKDLPDIKIVGDISMLYTMFNSLG
ncbi:MAG: C39 family peptidase [Acutalibacteraceae bacterium]|nr:C39 family peptidase [Acutalibacteraceae bacterium]